MTKMWKIKRLLRKEWRILDKIEKLNQKMIKAREKRWKLEGHIK